MHPFIKVTVKTCAEAGAAVLLGTAAIALASGSALFLSLKSALLGTLVYALVQIVFAASALAFHGAKLSAGIVIYRALYAYVLKYLLLFALFYAVLKFINVSAFTFIAAFCASLLVQLPLSLLSQKNFSQI